MNSAPTHIWHSLLHIYRIKLMLHQHKRFRSIKFILCCEIFKSLNSGPAQVLTKLIKLDLASFVNEYFKEKAKQRHTTSLTDKFDFSNIIRDWSLYKFWFFFWRADCPEDFSLVSPAYDVESSVSESVSISLSIKYELKSSKSIVNVSSSPIFVSLESSISMTLVCDDVGHSILLMKPLLLSVFWYFFLKMLSTSTLKIASFLCADLAISSETGNHKKTIFVGCD